MQNAVIYTRVSTDEQARNNLSLRGQYDAALKYCKANEINLVEHFSDKGESAKTANRPELIQALNFIQQNKGKVQLFIVWKLDRLARRTEDHIFIKAHLTKCGVSLVSVTEPINDDPTGRLMETILAGYSQFDNDVRAERSGQGIKRRIEEGGWPHYAPLGYVNIKDNFGRPTILQDSESTKIYQLLQAYRQKDMSLREVHNLSTKLNLRTKKRKESFLSANNPHIKKPNLCRICSLNNDRGSCKGLTSRFNYTE